MWQWRAVLTSETRVFFLCCIILSWFPPPLQNPTKTPLGFPSRRRGEIEENHKKGEQLGILAALESVSAEWQSQACSSELRQACWPPGKVRWRWERDARRRREPPSTALIGLMRSRVNRRTNECMPLCTCTGAQRLSSQRAERSCTFFFFLRNLHAGEMLLLPESPVFFF